MLKIASEEDQTIWSIESLACMYLQHVPIECVIRASCTVDNSHYHFSSILNKIFALNTRRHWFRTDTFLLLLLKTKKWPRLAKQGMLSWKEIRHECHFNGFYQQLSHDNEYWALSILSC